MSFNFGNGSVPRKALIVGNGFTKSLVSHIGLDYDPSDPLSWPIFSPGKISYLLDDLPHLRAMVSAYAGKESGFSIFSDLVRRENSPGDFPLPPDKTSSAVLDACHFLAIAFSQFQIIVDSKDIDNWAWMEWLRINSDAICCVLSWNYDLIAELALARSGRPYSYPGVFTTCEGGKIDFSRPAVSICKPHGSCNFASEMRMSAIDDSGELILPVYPRPIEVTACDSRLRILGRNELLSVRECVDLVLPGEINRFSPHVSWIDHAIEDFSRHLACAEELVVVGFSMMDCDREEFLRAIGGRSKLSKVTIVDPCPNPALIDCLREMCLDDVDLINPLDASIDWRGF